jgi:hypothetical protein
MATLGIRINNPGNLRPFKENFYLGQSGLYSNGEAEFKDMLHGLRALAMDLSIKINRGINTIVDIAEIYAPRKDKNNPTEWAKNVSQASGLNAYNQLNDLTTTLLYLMRGVIFAENGNNNISDAEILQGIEFYKTGKEPTTGSNYLIWLLLAAIGYYSYKKIKSH